MESYWLMVVWPCTLFINFYPHKDIIAQYFRIELLRIQFNSIWQLSLFVNLISKLVNFKWIRP